MKLQNIFFLAATLACFSIKAQNISQNQKNYIVNKVYDDNGNVISHTQTYKDKLGRVQQIQSKDLENSRILVNQSIYDQFGRKAIQSLTAPVYKSLTDEYLTNFFQSTSGNKYSLQDFDNPLLNNSIGEIFNPQTVQNTTPGTLGWYYSNNNSQESYVPASSFPYYRNYFSDFFRGNLIGSGKAGVNLKLGSNHESRQFVMSQGKEIEYVTGNTETVSKVISVDEDGAISINYYNQKGNLRAACKSGVNLGSCNKQVSQYLLTTESNNVKNNFIEVHIANNANSELKFIKNLMIYKNDGLLSCDDENGLAIQWSSVNFKIVDLWTGETLQPGIDYSIANPTGLVTFMNGYDEKDLFLKISLLTNQTGIPEQTVEVTTDYSNWTLYEYNTHQELTKVISPLGVNCSNNLSEIADPLNCDSTKQKIGTVVNDCDVLENNVTYESNIFSSFDSTTERGEYRFYLRIFGESNQFTDCIGWQSCGFYSSNPSSRSVASNVGGGNEATYNFESEEDPEDPNPNLENARKELNLSKLISEYFEQENRGSIEVTLETTPEASNYEDLYPDYLMENDEQADPQDYLFPSSTYEYTYNQQVGSGGSYPNGNDSGSTDMTWEGATQIINDLLGDADPGEIERLYCENTWYSCYDGIQNCDETDVDEGGHCMGLPCTASRPGYKREGTFKVTLVSQGKRRDNGNWENVEILTSNYDRYFRTLREDDPDSTIDYIFDLEYNCACNYRLFLQSGDPEIRGILGQEFLGTYSKVRFKLEDYLYAPGNYYRKIYTPIDFTNQEIHTLGRGIGLKYKGTLSKKVKLIAPTHDPIGITEYTYNNYGQITSETSPDEGTTEYIYDDLHRLNFWRNAEQSSNGKYSYLRYDDMGRVIEKGILASPTPPSNPISTYSLSEQHLIEYDDVGSSFPSANFPNYEHNFNKGKVTRTNNNESITWYGYDMRGRLIWTIQKVEALNQYFTINYTYHENGNIEFVDFQKENTAERLIHKYHYDANARLVRVETSTDNIAFTTHAEYKYYQHGALKRIELGDDLQGIDYVYTINGRLKSINNPTLASRDPGKDGVSGSVHASFAEDIFGLTLDYYRNDYIRDGTEIQSYSEHYYDQQSNLVMLPSQYNGNIQGVRWQTRSQVHTSTTEFEGSQLMYMPKYDDFNRLTSASFGTISNANVGFQNTNTSPPSGQFDGPSPQILDDFKVWDLQYDLNSNIVALKRNGNDNFGLDMDELSLNRSGNKLQSVTDAISNDPYAGDITHQTNSSNYTYDASGKLTADIAGSNYISYNSNSLPFSIHSNNLKTTLKSRLFYDERGQRIKKESFRSSGEISLQQYYIRDISGNLMAVINHEFGVSESFEPPTISNTTKSYPLYGSGQLGFYHAGDNSFSYQLTDHLGNVRATIGGAKVGGEVELLSMQDYYPFGSPMPGRSITNSAFYKQTYQGQQLDEETGFNAFELRLYDARIGGWLSTDPYQQYHSPYLAMSNNPFSFIDPDGGLAGPSLSDANPDAGDDYDWLGWTNPSKQGGGGGGARINVMDVLNACPSCKGSEALQLMADFNATGMFQDYTIERINNNIAQRESYWGHAYNAEVTWTSQKYVEGIGFVLDGDGGAVGELKLDESKLINADLIESKFSTVNNSTQTYTPNGSNLNNANDALTYLTYVKAGQEVALQNVKNIVPEITKLLKLTSSKISLIGMAINARQYQEAGRNNDVLGQKRAKTEFILNAIAPFGLVGASVSLGGHISLTLNPEMTPPPAQNFKHNSVVSCVVKGTLVKTPQGFRMIEDLAEGDKIVTYNLDTKTAENHKIEEFTKGGVSEYVRIDLENGETLNLTKAHPILVGENNWIIAEDIKKEDKVLILIGEKLQFLKVNSVSIVKQNTYTYNINVENNNFLITESNVLVLGIRQLKLKLNNE